MGLASSGIQIEIDASAIEKMADRFAAAAERTPVELSNAINRAGDAAKAEMQQVLVPQTGLSIHTMKRAIKTDKRSRGGGDYVIKSGGGNVRLKFFKARETRRGVTAAPWNKRRLYPKTFQKGGLWDSPKGRVNLNLGGAVMMRVGASRLPVTSIRSGLFIPDEMVTKNSKQAFDNISTRVLDVALPAALEKIMPT